LISTAGPATRIDTGEERRACGSRAPFSDILEFSAQNEKIEIARVSGRRYNFFTHRDFTESTLKEKRRGNNAFEANEENLDGRQLRQLG
jgi:hypothetical protein